MIDTLDRRRCGVLLHPTSLPGREKTGTLGYHAYRFVDFLSEGGFSVWQTLPLGPVDSHGSPYCQSSSYAGDARLIDVDALKRSKALPREMNFAAAKQEPVEAYRSFRAHASGRARAEFSRFVRRHRRWLYPYGIFELCRTIFGYEPWWNWPAPYRNRFRDDLVGLTNANIAEFRGTIFQQYLFELQWAELKRYANGKGIAVFGDLPFYVDRNSVEVWWAPQRFRLDSRGNPEAVAGVPPDYFNEDGQLWGNPLYDWERMREDDFAWWRERLRGQLRHFDLLRIDHFRALHSYWEVPASADTAREGAWRPGAGYELLSSLRENLGKLPLVAEDLGIITEEVYALRDEFGLPGMTVVQFAFDGHADNPHLPANQRENTVAYTGTHDNDTLLGWYRSLEEAARHYVRSVLDAGDRAMPEFIIDAIYASRARLVILPMQDLLGLDSSARMNTPGRTEGNWTWRFDWEQVDPSVAVLSRKRAAAHDRLTISEKTASYCGTR